MKTLIAFILSATAISTAHAADVTIAEPIATAPVVVEDMRNIFIEGRFGIGPALLDLDVDTDEVDGTILGGAVPITIPATNGEIESDLLYGGAVEAGYFLTPNFRLSVEGIIGRLENDQIDIDGPADVVTAAPVGPFPAETPVGALDGSGVSTLSGNNGLDGGATIYQGFVKAGVEFPILNDILFIRQLSLTANAGVGLVHLEVDVTQEGGLGDGNRIDDSDTVLGGKVGVGTVSQLTDSLSLVNEVSYLFAEDGEFTTETPDGNSVPTRIETEAITFQTGLRLRF